MKARDNACRSIVRMVEQETRIRIWSPESCINYYGSSIPPGFPYYLGGEWPRATMTPSPSYPAFHNTLGTAWKPLYRAPFAPPDVPFHAIPHLVAHERPNAYHTEHPVFEEHVTVHQTKFVRNSERIEVYRSLYPSADTHCPYTDSAPLSSMSVVALDRVGHPHHLAQLLLRERKGNLRYELMSWLSAGPFGQDHK